MKRYRCYYAREPAYVGLGSRMTVERFQRSGAWPTAFPPPEAVPRLFTVERLTETHVLVQEVEAASLGAVFGAMQDDGRTPQQRAMFDQIRDAHDLTHSSLAPGDVVEDREAGIFYECDVFGWRTMQ